MRKKPRENPSSRSAAERRARESRHTTLECVVCGNEKVQFFKIKEPINIDGTHYDKGYICVWCKEDVKE